MITITFDKLVYIPQLIEELSAAGFKSCTYMDSYITVQDADDQSAVMTVYDAHDPTARIAYNEEKRTSQDEAVTNYTVLPDWIKTWTANDVSTYVHDNVLSGLDVAGVDAYVDNLPNTVAGMKTGLKQIGSALVAIRDILEIIAKLLMYIRDLVIRFRQ